VRLWLRVRVRVRLWFRVRVRVSVRVRVRLRLRLRVRIRVRLRLRRELASYVFPCLVVLSTDKRNPKSRFYQWQVPQEMIRDRKPR
jgi:hypothetical protein